MNDLKLFQKFRKGIADGLVDSHRTKASPHNHKDWFFFVESGHGKGRSFASLTKFLTDGASGENGFAFRKIRNGFREVTADFGGGWHGQFIGQPRRQVRFVADDRNVAASGCHNDWDGDKSSLGKYHIRFQLFHQFGSLCKSFQDAERIGKVFNIKIASQLSGGNAIVGNSLSLDEFFLDSFGGADIEDFVIFGTQTGKQCNVRCYVTGSAAACKYNTFHVKMSSLIRLVNICNFIIGVREEKSTVIGER